jgi:PAS domain S-box-containing protein
LQNRDAKPLQRLLEIAYPVIDSIDVYLQSEDGAFSVQRTGDLQPFARRPIEHRHFLFPVDLKPHQTKQLYVRVQTVSAMQVPLILWSERLFWITDQHELLIQAIYFGTMLVMMLYNFFVYLAVRDKSYLFYVAFVTVFALFQATLHGFSYHYLWPGYPWLNGKMLGVTVSAAIGFGAFFTIELLRLGSNYRRLYQGLYILAVIGSINALAAFFIPYHSAVLVALMTSLVGCCLGLTAGLLTWRRGYPPARYYTFAWACFLIGTCFFALNKFGLLPTNLFTENAMQLGSALEVVLLSFALANRINVTQQEKVQAQNQALAILQKYRSLYENAIEGIFQCMPDYRFVHVNRAMAQMLGFPDAETLLSCTTVTLKQCFVDPREATRFCTRLAAEEKVSEYEGCGQRRDGNTFWGYWSIHGVYDSTGNLLHYEGSVIDISLRKEKEQAERARQIAEESARAKNQFLATMSHEIRTPLNGVLGMTDLLLTTSLTNKQRHYADTVRRSGKHLMGIINDILDLAKIEAGKLELQETAFDLRLLLEDLAELFAERAHRKGLELICSIPPTLLTTFYGDAPRLNQILINLVGNAVKFTEHGQVVIRLVSVKNVDVDSDKGMSSQVMAHIAIEDTGPGIEAAQQAHIFESFSQADNTPTQRRHEGSGLGLTIAKQLVELMGGQIGLDSVLGRGTTFWFTVPLNHYSAVSPVSAETPLKNAHLLADKNLTGRILIVEDNPVNAEIAGTILDSYGCQFQSAENGRIALDVLTQEVFDLILMDCHMPELDGYATTVAIRQREMTSGEHTPIVALTANAMASEREHCLKIGMDDYLSKPFTPKQLYDVLQQWLPQQTVRKSSLKMAEKTHPN